MLMNRFYIPLVCATPAKRFFSWSARWVNLVSHGNSLDTHRSKTNTLNYYRKAVRIVKWDLIIFFYLFR